MSDNYGFKLEPSVEGVNISCVNFSKNAMKYNSVDIPRISPNKIKSTGKVFTVEEETRKAHLNDEV